MWGSSRDVLQAQITRICCRVRCYQMSRWGWIKCFWLPRRCDSQCKLVTSRMQRVCAHWSTHHPPTEPQYCVFSIEDKDFNQWHIELAALQQQPDTEGRVTSSTARWERRKRSIMTSACLARSGAEADNIGRLLPPSTQVPDCSCNVKCHLSSRKPYDSCAVFLVFCCVFVSFSFYSVADLLD